MLRHSAPSKKFSGFTQSFFLLKLIGVRPLDSAQTRPFVSVEILQTSSRTSSTFRKVPSEWQKGRGVNLTLCEKLQPTVRRCLEAFTSCSLYSFRACCDWLLSDPTSEPPSNAALASVHCSARVSHGFLRGWVNQPIACSYCLGSCSSD